MAHWIVRLTERVFDTYEPSSARTRREDAIGGTQFAFIKATEGGDHLDPRFSENWDGAAQAGVPRGAYHFMYWCRPAHEQAAWFRRNVPNDSNALPPVLDLEWNGHSRTCPMKLPRETALAPRRWDHRAHHLTAALRSDLEDGRSAFGYAEVCEPEHWLNHVRQWPAGKIGFSAKPRREGAHLHSGRCFSLAPT